MDEDRFLNLDSLVVREKPKWGFLNPKLSGSHQTTLDELFNRNGVESVTPIKGDVAFRWPTDATKRQGLESEIATLINETDLNGHLVVQLCSS